MFLSGFGACSDGGLLLRKRLLWMHLRGFEACSDGGVPLRTRRPGMHLEASLPGRCLGGVTSSLRASESDVRHFSWVVWRCVFVWFWGVF